MPLNKYALLRYRIIDRCLRNRAAPFPSKEELRLACEESLYGSEGANISISTIEKDIWAMRNEGELGYYAPIQFNKKHGGYYYSDETYTISEIDLSPEDLEAIRFAALTLEEYRHIPIFSRFESSIKKLVDRMRVGPVNDVEDTSAILFEKDIISKGYEYLIPLWEAIRHRNRIIIRYRKFGSDRGSEYFLEPLCLKEYRNMWYLVVNHTSKGKRATFGLDRIESLTVTDTKFVFPEDFRVDTFFEHSVGVSTSEEPPVEVEIRIHQRWFDYLQSHPIHHSQQLAESDGEMFSVRLLVCPSAELTGMLLGFGPDAEVIAPQRLRDDMMQALRECLDRYEK